MATEITVLCDICRAKIHPGNDITLRGNGKTLRVQKLVYTVLGKEKCDLCINCFCRIIDQLRDEENEQRS
jgi:hypothetical protein